MNPFAGATADPLYNTALLVAFSYVAVVIVSAWFVATPYGRFASGKFGINLDARLGWFLMEVPAWLTFLIAFGLGESPWEPVRLLFAAIFLLHYAYRGWYFPLSIRVAPGSTSSFSLMVVVTGWLATTLHGYLNGAYFAGLGAHYTVSWLTDPRFIAGVVTYYMGLAIVVQSDHILRSLRPKGGQVDPGERYKIPYGGLYRYVSSPAYFGELLAWLGFAVMTWCPGGVYIFMISAANLVPRAFATHRWYQEKFAEYPGERRALIPFVC